MMKRITLLLVGISPFILSFLYFSGFIFKSGTHDRSSAFLLFQYIAGVAFLGLWFLVGWMSQKFIRSRIEMMLLLNATALLMLLLQLYCVVFFADVNRKISLSYGFSNVMEMVSYYFYFPFFMISLDMTHIFYGQEIHGFLQYAVPFFCLVIFSLLGRIVAERRERKAKM